MKFKKYSASKRIAVGCLAMMMGFSAPVFSFNAGTVAYAAEQNIFVNGDDIVVLARSYVGKLPYGGGKSLETSVDCAWFAGRIFEKFGINIYSTSYRYGYSTLSGYLFYQGQDIGTVIGTDPKLAQAGDLIVTPGHVAIATGTGTAVSALNQGVREHPVQDGDPYHYFGGYNGVFKIIRVKNVKASGTYNDPLKGMYKGTDYSPVFDFDYYYAKYPKLAEKYGKLTASSTSDEKFRVASECLKYFVEEGMAKGEQASENFNVELYRRNYSDLESAYGKNTALYYQHYIRYGVKEGRNATKILKPVTVYEGIDYSAVYNYEYYQNRYSDIKAAFGYDDAATLMHFVRSGMREGRQGSASFNVNAYKKNYPELANQLGTDNAAYYLDYVRSGAEKKRNATSILNPITSYKGINYSSIYDFNYYIEKYPDLKAAFGFNDEAAIQHFVTRGMKEGRQASREFDYKIYMENYPGLVKKYGTDRVKYYLDYLQTGKKLGRNGATKNPLSTLDGVDYSAVYDFNYYQNKYPDIKAAFGNNEEATLRHFVKYGMKEGRQGNEAFDVFSYRNEYSDLRQAFGSNRELYYTHYTLYGQYENRIATGVTTVRNPITKGVIVIDGQETVVDFAAVYDFNYYINRYPDLKAAFKNDDIGALKHFIKSGMREGRQASERFNLAYYKGTYADLRKNIGVSVNDNYKYYLHYINRGIREGRKGSDN